MFAHGGRGVARDLPTAARLLERAAVLGSVPAMTAVAVLLWRGVRVAGGTPTIAVAAGAVAVSGSASDADAAPAAPAPLQQDNTAMAAVWFRRAADAGDHLAAYYLAKILLSIGGELTRTVMPRRAVSRVPGSAAAASSDSNLSAPAPLPASAQSSARIGEAIALFERAAAAGHADAAESLALLYHTGSVAGGVASSKARALRWHMRAAELGSASSACAAGDLLLRGDCGDQRDAALITSATPSASSASAQADSSSASANAANAVSDAVFKDESRACALFEQGAAANHILSIASLATLLQRGALPAVPKVRLTPLDCTLHFGVSSHHGVFCHVSECTQDESRARELYKRGAELGDSLCMFGFARCCERGLLHSAPMQPSTDIAATAVLQCASDVHGDGSPPPTPTSATAALDLLWPASLAALALDDDAEESDTFVSGTGTALSPAYRPDESALRDSLMGIVSAPLSARGFYGAGTGTGASSPSSAAESRSSSIRSTKKAASASSPHATAASRSASLRPASQYAVAPDVEAAREWYARSAALGCVAARTRLAELTAAANDKADR